MPPSAQLLLDAKAALASGDNARALEALNASIDAQPTVWALVERARLNAKLGSDQAARDDCRQLRSLDPENRDAAWLEGELKKPAADRFEGKFADPPSARK
ncbi:MAG: hypothetical protein IT424_11170 [Pirellulales bacterium]|nr:hypothetical protein [Pirellulales bacterium]